MDKNVRQNKIKELILANEIDTQEELVELLNEYNFNVTQATVSRDVKQLGLVKIAGVTRKYRYSEAKAELTFDQNRMYNLFKNCVTSIVLAKNLVIVKTLTGHGGSAGMVIDTLKIPEIVGSIAGDDTVLVVTLTDEQAKVVSDQLEALI